MRLLKTAAFISTQVIPRRLIFVNLLLEVLLFRILAQNNANVPRREPLTTQTNVTHMVASVSVNLTVLVMTVVAAKLDTTVGQNVKNVTVSVIRFVTRILENACARKIRRRTVFLVKRTPTAIIIFLGVICASVT